MDENETNNVPYEQISDEERFFREVVRCAWIAVAYGIYPSVMIAQAILETGWGSRFAAPNNCFGRKFKFEEESQVPGEPYPASTKEYLPEKDEADDGKDGWQYLGEGWWKKTLYFKAYANIEDCLRDYADRIANHPLYALAKEAAGRGAYEDYVYAVASRWATDPQYAKKLFGIIDENDLRQIDQAACAGNEPIQVPAGEEVPIEGNEGDGR